MRHSENIACKMIKGKILVIDDVEDSSSELLSFLFNQGYEVKIIKFFEENIDVFNSEAFDIVFFSVSNNKEKVLEDLQKLKNHVKNKDIVLVVDPAIASLTPVLLKNGASEFVLKPYKLDEVLFVVERLMGKRKIEKDLDTLLYENIELVELVSLYRRIIRIVTNLDILKLKEQLLEEIMECTFGKGAIFYALQNQEEGILEYDLDRGEVNKDNQPKRYLKKFIDDADTFFYYSSNELNIPVRSDEKLYGLVKVINPVLKEGFTEKEFNKAMHLCEFMALAFENASRFESLKKSTVKDAKTNAYYWDIFKDFVNKEIYKSLRYDRKLSLLGLRVENLSELRKYHAEKNIQTALLEFSDVIQNVIRDSDWFVERKEGDFLVFLTETDYFGSLMVIPRIRKGLLGKCIIKAAQRVDELQINIAAAGLPLHGISLDELINTLDSRLTICRNSMFHKLNVHKYNFEEICDSIMKRYGHAENPLYTWKKKENENFIDYLMLALREAKVNPQRRGILYAGVFDGEKVNSVMNKDDLGNILTKVYFFCKENKDKLDINGIFPVGIEKIQYGYFNFMLILNEYYTYMQIFKDDLIFESSDFLLVEELISKLQSEYYLQWQL